jgi:hypothetical protein
MKIDLNKEIHDRNGNRITAKVKVPHVTELEDGEIVEEQRFQAVILNLGRALRDSVLTISPIAVSDLEEKMYRYRLFQKLEKDRVVDLTDEEIEKLKKYVAERYEVIFCGQVVDMLDAK